ncbi:MAG: bifunctional riboflavin kinase/FAD synthetase [Bacteroidota bacterium]
MQVHYSSDNLPVFRNAIVTIGTFDGVHTGHCQVLHQLKTEAKAVNGESVIITFDPHPRKVLANTRTEIKLINTLDEKIILLQKQGIDHLVVVPFTPEFANQPAEDYVEKFLVEKFQPHTIIIGYDHQFGHNREGNYLLLEAMKDQFGFRVKEITEQILNNIIISSTKIRQAIVSGNIEEANDFLGYPYFFEGKVVEGNKLGRTIGYPTANLEINNTDKLVPGDGVYAVSLDPIKILTNQTTTQQLFGMMNIGIRPTIGGTKRVIEVNIFDFNEEIYGSNLTVYLHKRLRGELKFNGLDALKAQLAIDKARAVTALKAL